MIKEGTTYQGNNDHDHRVINTTGDSVEQEQASGLAADAASGFEASPGELAGRA